MFKNILMIQVTDLHFGEGEDTTWGPEQDKVYSTQKSF